MPNTPAVAAELRRAVMLRAQELHEVVQHLRGPLGGSRSSLRSALDLVERFPDQLRNVVDREWDRNADSDSRSLILTSLLRHANYVADFVELHLAHGTRRELSEALVEEIRRELLELGLSEYGVVIAHGEAYNFTTKFGDLAKAILGPLNAGGNGRDGASCPVRVVPNSSNGGIRGPVATRVARTRGHPHRR